MKSYSEHLKSTKRFGEEHVPDYRPTMRSSAIFPLLHKPNKLLSIYTFMGYWLRKRKIQLVTAVVTLRNKDGKTLKVHSIEVADVRAFKITSTDLLDTTDQEFIGSVEIEIFSAIDMVFPYPAITFAIKGISGLTFVHTCGRIYNNFVDLHANAQQVVKETGFDLYVGSEYTPFLAFVNGPIEIASEIVEMEYIEQNGHTSIETVKLENVKPYGLGWINFNLDKIIPPTNKLVKLCVKVKHNFRGFFPRFIAGNILREHEDIGLTHSYYDTSSDKTDGAIWKNPNIHMFEDGVVAIPFDTEFSAIELAIYPNFASSPFKLKYDLHDPAGQIVSSITDHNQLGTDSSKLAYVDIIDIFSAHLQSTPKGMVRVVFSGNGSVPTRMKFGLNLHKATCTTDLPSNICFNASVPNEKMLLKPGTFRWCTIFDARSQKIYLHNTSFVKAGFNDAEIIVEVYRESDAQILEWHTRIPYNGTIDILENRKESVANFLADDTGWISFSCSSPFISGYYITDLGHGVIGADHLY